jgi:hypothetical protein
VAEDRIDPSDQIPEADLLEQQAALDPPLTDAEHMQVVVPEAPTEPVNEADRWEQQRPCLRRMTTIRTTSSKQGGRGD